MARRSGEPVEYRGAGILFLSAEGLLLLIRSRYGFWEVPGGHRERGEAAWVTAMRESLEEVGFAPPANELVPLTKDDTGFFLYGVELGPPFAVELSEEHVEWGWFRPSALPSPLHPGLVASLARISA